jgi:hypothetical protein
MFSHQLLQQPAGHALLPTAAAADLAWQHSILAKAYQYKQSCLLNLAPTEQGTLPIASSTSPNDSNTGQSLESRHLTRPGSSSVEETALEASINANDCEFVRNRTRKSQQLIQSRRRSSKPGSYSIEAILQKDSQPVLEHAVGSCGSGCDEEDELDVVDGIDDTNRDNVVGAKDVSTVVDFSVAPSTSA